MRLSIAFFPLLLLSLGAQTQAQAARTSPSQSTVLFITSVSLEERAFLMEQSFAQAWHARDPGASVFNYRFSAFSFPPSERGFELAGEELAERLSGRKLALVVAQGDPSIDLAVRFRKGHYPLVPIVSFEATERARNLYSDVVGLFQMNTVNFTKENLELGRALFPNAKQACILATIGADASTYLSEVSKLQTEYPSLRLTIVLNPTHDSVDAALRASPKESFVILLSPGWANAEGRLLVGKELISSIEGGYGLPVLAFIREFLGEGLVGGVGVSARDFGKAAAGLGLSIVLDGKKPGAWISSEGLSSGFVHYPALARFGSSLSLVPEGAEIVDPPVPLWVRFRDLIQASITLLLLAVTGLVVYLLSKRRERKTLLRANEVLELKVDERTTELQIANEGLSATNENLTFMVKRTEAMQESVLRNAREATLGRLAAGIAHELNSPLNAIRSANGAIGSVLADAEGGLAERLLAMDERQLSLFRRYAPQVLGRTLQELSGPGIPSAELGSLAAELREAGLSAVDEGAIRDFSEDFANPVLKNLFRLSILHRSAYIVDAAVDQVIASVQAVREYAAESQSEGASGAFLLRQSMERALLLLKNRLPNSIVLRTDFADLPPVRGDEASFVRLWAHLIQNALQAMGGGGRLALSIRREGDYALVSVDDEGEGISALVADRLFEPFVTTRPLAEGMGLGLAYCKRISESAGGTISFTRKQRGTAFTVRLPIRGEA